MYCQLKMPDNVNLDVEFVAPDLEEKPCGHQPERQSRQHFQVHGSPVHCQSPSMRRRCRVGE